jgi:hypothetical protein
MALDTTISLVTLADARAMIGKEAAETQDDAMIEILIDGVSAKFNSYVGRRILEQTETTAYLDGNGKGTLFLPRYPSVTITSLTESDITLTEGKDKDFRIYADEGMLKRLGGCWAVGKKNIVLTSYKAGWAIASLPKDLKLAALMQVAAEFQEFKNRSWAEVSRSMGDGSMTKREVSDFLPQVKATLDKYKDYRV